MVNKDYGIKYHGAKLGKIPYGVNCSKINMVCLPNGDID